MTYEELFIAIDEAAPKLPGCALRVLLRLIAMAIKSGSNEIRISIRTLSAEMEITKDAVTVATLALKDVITTNAAPGVPCTFTLPAAWFAPQRSLFRVAGSVENRLRRPGNQDTSVLETRTPLSEKPGQSVLETRTQWATYQDGVSRKPGHLGDFPGHSVLETRTLNTQNQQLTGAPDSIDWIKGLSSREDLVDALDRLVRVDRVGKQQQEDAEILRGRLVVYRQEFGQHELARIAPDDKIVARCLRIACIAELCATLNQMAAERIVPKPKNAWFVTLLLNKIHGVPPELTAERIRLRYERKPPSSIQNPKFGRDLVASTQLSMGVMR